MSVWSKYQGPYRVEVEFHVDGVGSRILDADGREIMEVNEWAERTDNGEWRPGPFARHVLELLNARPFHNGGNQ